jgi:hypothetical protein
MVMTVSFSLIHIFKLPITSVLSCTRDLASVFSSIDSLVSQFAMYTLKMGVILLMEGGFNPYWPVWGGFLSGYRRLGCDTTNGHTLLDSSLLTSSLPSVLCHEVLGSVYSKGSAYACRCQFAGMCRDKLLHLLGIFEKNGIYNIPDPACTSYFLVAAFPLRRQVDADHFLPNNESGEWLLNPPGRRDVVEAKHQGIA